MFYYRQAKCNSLADFVEIALLTEDMGMKHFEKDTHTPVRITGPITYVSCSHPGCAVTFANAKNMKKHLRLTHMPNSIDSQGFDCTHEGYCKTYKTRAWLERHSKKCHSTSVFQPADNTNIGQTRTPVESKLPTCHINNLFPHGVLWKSQFLRNGLYCCPLDGCNKKVRTYKGIENHCYAWHGYSLRNNWGGTGSD
ncbi:unnamed protein product [Gordionus sp. m RMFG-2023]